MPAAVYNIELEQGVDFSNLLAITDASGAAMNLTGYTFKSQIRKIYSAPDVIASFTVAISGDPSLGIVQMSLPADTSDSIKLNAGADYRLTPTKFAYDLIMTAPSGQITRLLQGFVEISPRVTQ